jgi:xylulose-5-phosphate/fructose-6-phosphate phosphoketolase
MIKKYDLDAFVISGPGHGAPGLISNFYLEGVWSETYGNTPENKEGLQRFFKQFSFPGGHGSHMTPEVGSPTAVCRVGPLQNYGSGFKYQRQAML